MDLEFAYYVSLLKRIAQNQLVLDKKFAEEFFSLRRKMYAKRISPKEFWTGYKKILLTSLESNKKLAGDIFKKTEKKYVLVDPIGLTEAVSYFRSMKDLLLFEYSSSYKKGELEKKLPKTAVYCLESALAKYSNYYVSNIVSVYLPKKEAISLKQKLGVGIGNKTILKVFEEKPMISKKNKMGEKQYTSQVRTIIDLACDKKGAMADKLIEHIWGKK